MTLKNTFLASCAFAFLSLSSLPQAAYAEDFSPEQKTAIEAIVRDYMLQNPELLEQMIAALEAKREVATQAQMGEVLAQLKPQIFNGELGQIMGNPEGKVTLVEFYDYNCGVCRSEYEVVRELIKNNPDLKVILWEWPVVRPPESIDAARVSLAVRNLHGKDTWETFHTKLMQSGVLADKASSLDIAKDMALDLAAIEAELNSEAVVRHLQASTGLGDALGFRGTPTFVIGDKVVAGGGRMDELQGLVEAELAKLN